jgi:PHD/YefM family antitoxin component YafN of YafNO toxin-antitoxin module
MAAHDSAFSTVSLHQAQGKLLALYERIACEKGRVEIIDASGACACVLISKSELESLENALAMLSDGDQVRAMRQCLEQVAAAVQPVGAQA